jgi:Cof subfamily protein (haloacid dehalogenase superfamily)
MFYKSLKLSSSFYICGTMKNIKAICTDIDGTLLDANRGISPRLKNAIAQLPKNFPLILASSRMPDAMRYLQFELGKEKFPLICYNGGFVIDDAQNGKVLEDVFISVGICEEISDYVKQTGIHMSLYHGENWFAPKFDDWTAKEVRNTKVIPYYQSADKVISTWMHRGEGAHKVMCMGLKEEIQALFTWAEGRFGDDLHLYRSKDTYIEIAPKQISKASGLELVLRERFEIEMDEVMSFGDNYNDIDLLQKSGWGVAVGNARDEVKKIANEVTFHHKEDGVAQMIEKYLI